MYIMSCRCETKTSTRHKHARVAQRWSISLPRRGSRVRSPSRALGNRRFSVPFFIVKSGLCGHFGNKITGDFLWLLLVTFFGVFNHFEYTWMIMKGKVFNLVCFFKNKLWQKHILSLWLVCQKTKKEENVKA